MSEATLTELDKAWRERDAESMTLAAAGHLSIALAFRVYALEIRTKARICRHLNLENLPKVCKTHDLFELLIYTGLLMEMNEPGNADLLSNWYLIAEFSRRRLNEIRYTSVASFDPVEHASITTALDDPTIGVLTWLSKHP